MAAFLLCWSFHLLPGPSEQLIFGPYFLVPFGFALAVLLLELGIVARNRVVQVVALVAARSCNAGAIGHKPDAIYHEFLATSRTGWVGRRSSSPSRSGFFHLYAWARRISLAPEGLTIVLALLTFVGPETLTLADLGPAIPAFLVFAVLLQMWIALCRWDLIRALGIASFAIAWLGTIAWRGYRELRESVPGLDFIAVSLVLLPVAVLISLGKGGVFASRAEASRDVSSE